MEVLVRFLSGLNLSATFGLHVISLHNLIRKLTRSLKIQKESQEKWNIQLGVLIEISRSIGVRIGSKK
jgi:hypothetical protein